MIRTNGHLYSASTASLALVRLAKQSPRVSIGDLSWSPMVPSRWCQPLYPFVLPALSPSFRRHPADMMVDGPTRVIRFTDARSASVSSQQDRSSYNDNARLVRFFLSTASYVPCIYIHGDRLFIGVCVRVSFSVIAATLAECGEACCLLAWYANCLPPEHVLIRSCPRRLVALVVCVLG